MIISEARSLMGKRVRVVTDADTYHGHLQGVSDARQVTFWDEATNAVRVVDDAREVYLALLTCSRCSAETNRLFSRDEVSDLCADCYRDWAHKQEWRQDCDDCGASGVSTNVWRDPYTRKDEYFCANCHGKRGKTIQNRWFARVSKPLDPSRRPKCEAANVPGTIPCRGEVKPRGKLGSALCNAHSGRMGKGPNG